jgi:glycosyltransferase involved in cell wall biosynthesis
LVASATTRSLPVVSIITVCRNAAATLDTCITSVLAQTYPAIEYVVVDGASTDSTADILSRHRAGIAVLLSEPDRGLYDAMNKGIRLASGEFLLFMNADDYFADAKAVADAMAEIAAAPHADVYYGSLLVRMSGGKVRHDPPPPEAAAEEMVLGCLPHQATFARRAVFQRVGEFDLRWRRHADYDWWLKVMADPELRLGRIGRVIASYAMGGASSDLAKGQPEVYAIQNASPLYRSAEWDRRRLELFQQAYLKARVELTFLKAQVELSALPPEGGDGGVRQWFLLHAPAPIVSMAVRVRRWLRQRG